MRIKKIDLEFLKVRYFGDWRTRKVLDFLSLDCPEVPFVSLDHLERHLKLERRLIYQVLKELAEDGKIGVLFKGRGNDNSGSGTRIELSYKIGDIADALIDPRHPLEPFRPYVLKSHLGQEALPAEAFPPTMMGVRTEPKPIVEAKVVEPVAVEKPVSTVVEAAKAVIEARRRESESTTLFGEPLARTTLPAVRRAKKTYPKRTAREAPVAAPTDSGGSTTIYLRPDCPVHLPRGMTLQEREVLKKIILAVG